MPWREADVTLWEGGGKTGILFRPWLLLDPRTTGGAAAWAAARATTPPRPCRSSSPRRVDPPWRRPSRYHRHRHRKRRRPWLPMQPTWRTKPVSLLRPRSRLFHDLLASRPPPLHRGLRPCPWHRGRQQHHRGRVRQPSAFASPPPLPPRHHHRRRRRRGRQRRA